MQYLVEVRPGGAPRGGQTDQQSCNEGDGETKAEDAPIKTEIKADWNVRYIQPDGADQTRGPYAYHGPKNRTHKCQQEAFCEQLADDAAAGSAQRGTDGKLAFTRRGAYQHNIGDVGARQ